MKTKGIFLLAMLSAVILSPCLATAENWDVEFNNKLGGAYYQEAHESLDSQWFAFYYEGVMALNYYKEQGLHGRIDVGVPFTTTGEETWKVDHVKFQNDDMNLWGMESNIELGYTIPVLLDNMNLIPIGRYGFNFTRFDRSGLTISSRIRDTAVVDEDYWVQHVDIGGRVIYNVSEKLKVNFKGFYGFVVSSSTDNSVVGTIEGEGGYVVRAETNVNYNFYESWVFGMGAFFDVQHLEGATKDNFTWPVSNLYTFGGNVSIKYTF